MEPISFCFRDLADGQWYRAIVLEVSDSAANIVYADYGNLETLPFSLLRPIKESFLHPPVQTTRCRIDGVAPVNQHWSIEASQALVFLLQPGDVVITVRSVKAGIYSVSVKKTLETGTICVEEKLVKDCLARCEDSVRVAAGSKGNWSSCLIIHLDTQLLSTYSIPFLPIKFTHNTALWEFRQSKLYGAEEESRLLVSALDLLTDDDCQPLMQAFRYYKKVMEVLPCLAVQDLHVGPEITAKISAAAQRMSCSAPLDVLFLLDGSNSIGKGTFERSKYFVLKLTEALDIGTDQVRVGVIQYSTTPHLEFRLDSGFTKEDLREKIKAVTFRSGSTETGLALKYILRKGFPGGRGSSVPKILIILSDGKSQGHLGGPASLIKESGIEVFAIGVRFPRWAELHSLASDWVEQHVFFAEHVDDAVNGLCSSLSNSSVCNTIPVGCSVQSYPCERRTLETVKELAGNYVCWRGSTTASSVFAGHCPFYSWKRFFTKHQAECHRTVCPDPCDSSPCKNGGTCIVEESDKYRCVCPAGFGGDGECAPKLSLECSIDLLFLLDSSSSSSLETFMRHKSFLKRFIQASLADDSPVNVGVAQYSDNVQMVVKISEYENIAELLQLVDGMQFLRGGAYTGKALRYVTQHGFKSTPAFSDIRDDLPRVVVLLSGSMSQDSVSEPAIYARDHEVFLIGVSTDRIKEEMLEITGTPQNAITYDSPQQLFNQLPQLQKRICSVDFQGCQAQPLDLVFVLDASSGVGRENFNRLLNFVTMVSLQFDINADVTQMALVTYSKQPETVFGLDTYETGSGLLSAINQAGYLGGSPSTGNALLHVLNDVMTTQRGARPGVKKAVVVITDGKGAEDAAVPAQKLRDNGISVFTIGIAKIQRNALLRIAGTERSLTHIPNYNALSQFEDEIVQRVCEDAKSKVNPCKPNPCMNGGTCILQQNSYYCECHGWDGPHCENRVPRGDSAWPLPLTKTRRQRHSSRSHRSLKLLHHKKAQ
ncbi:von Willebrand factor A domain-containing protein 2 [Gastrophryne carolinensis]